jgi:hypothetical protein
LAAPAAGARLAVPIGRPTTRPRADRRTRGRLEALVRGEGLAVPGPGSDGIRLDG